MSTMTASYAPQRRSWLGRAEDWLDGHGRWAWFAAMVAGFVVFWPVGLALLAYMIWSKRMFSRSCAGNHGDRHALHARMHRHHSAFRSSGNTAFDAYKADTIERLEREQEEFEAFLARLRESKDKAEFDDYLEARARAARETKSPDAEPESKGGTSGHDDDRAGPGRY